GFTATYTVDTDDNIATIIVTRTGANDQTGEATLVTLPVRVWTLKTGYTYANGTKAGQAAMTLKQFYSAKEFWRMSIIANVDKGVLIRMDNTTDTFTGDRVFCDTEMWGNYAKMSATAEGLAYYNAWDGGHVHSAAAMADKAPTCTEDGYTGRTYCEGCASVVEWGTTVKATGHTHTLTDGVLKCTCGDLFNGVHTDGKTYVDSVVIADGWVEESYYKNGVKVTGLQKIGDYYYDFGTEGVCPNKARLDGFFYDESVSAYRYFTAGKLTTGEVNIYPEVYFFNADGIAISGRVNVLGYACTFGEKGEFVSSEDANVVDAGYCGTNIQYVLLKSGLLKVDGEGVMKDYTSNGIYPAWVIQNDATAITSLEIGAGITEIGRFGFYKNAYLRTITFAENSSLKYIGWAAFGHNWRLTGVTIPASVEKLEDYAFYECGAMTYIDFEEGSKLKYIGYTAFQHAMALETIYIPETVTFIGVDAFYKANADVVLKVAENSVGHNFALDHGMKYELREGTIMAVNSGKLTDTITWTLYSNGKLEITGSGAMPNFTSHTQQPWYSFNHQIKKIVIGKDITSVGNYAFCYAQKVTEVTFEEGSQLTNIGVLAFFNVPAVTSITLPETVDSINSYAFGDCFALENVYIPQGTGFIYKTAFSNSTNVVLNVSKGTYAEEFAVANNVKYTTRDFVYTPVASGKLTDTITWERYENGELHITGTGAMPNFASHKDQPWYTTNHLIKKIVIDARITSIGNYNFCYAQKVTEIVFEEGSQLQSIGVLSFFNVPSVKSITLPNGVTSISAYAFGDCFALESIYIPQRTGSIYKTAFSNSTKVVLNVAEGTYAEDFAKANNVKYTTRELVYDPLHQGSLSENVQWAIYDNGELQITGTGAMPNFASHKEQPWYNFNNLIKKIVIGKDITTVGNYAFCYAQNVTTITFEEGSQLQSIGVLSFMNVPSVKSITLPETVTSISAYAFADCFALESINLPAGMTFIYKNAFNNSTAVKLLVVENSYAHQYAQTHNIGFELA
ncbi:MAG: leucine-rich repeat domain-containing protein, partial [Clostridia bacterium]|nr:leucine-rich repeat domain-containing protein [Clostridia bacterium]